MADEETTTEAPKFDARLAEGVAYFEQMLEIMPEDRTTLEFLVVAYDQLGQHEKGQKALVELTKLLIKEGDLQALQGLLPRLQVSDYAPAKALFLKVSTLTAPAPDLTPETPKDQTEDEKTAEATLDAVAVETELLDFVKEGGVIDAEQYDQLLKLLQAAPTDGRVFLISALQILEKENPTLCEKAIEYLADKYGAPPIPLGAFEPNKKLFSAYPERLLKLRGVIPFAQLGGLTLLAVLNPADAKLKAELEKISKCRLYLAEPSAVEAALAKIYGSTN